MGLEISANSLLSRIIRGNLSNGLTGSALIIQTGLPEKPRKIESVSSADTNNSPGGGVVNRLLQTVKNFFNWAWSSIFNQAKQNFNRLLQSLFTSAFQYLISTFQTLWTFDWNASDEELKQLLSSQETLLGSAWGSFAGQGVGWIAALGVGYSMAHRCPVIGSGSLARLIASKVAQEGGEELAFGLKNALQVTLGVATRSFVVTRFAEIRRWLKSQPEEKLKGIVGDNAAKWMKNEWGAKDGPVMSFAEKVDNAVESIPNKFWRSFVEELLEESWDSFIEGGFIVANELDSALSQARLNNRQQLGPERTIEIKPDKQADDEKLRFVKMPQSLMIPQVQAALNQHRLLYNRDVGPIIGLPETDWGKARPFLRQLTITFRSRPSPPWRDEDGKISKLVTYSIPDVRVGLTWAEIKAVAKPFFWGKFRATATLDNRRQMAVYGNSPTEAKDTLKDLLRLSTAKMIALSVTEEEDRPTRLKKDSTRVYPAYGTLLARIERITPQGRVDLEGKSYEERLIRFALWTDKEPPDFEVVR